MSSAKHPFSFVRRAAATVLTSLTLAAVLGACNDSDSSKEGATAPRLTVGAGSQSTLIGRATFADAFKVKRETGDWEIEVEAGAQTDIAVQSITFQPGSYSGWHSHPGPVFIQVVSGTMTFYESHDPTCTPIVRTAGQGFLDRGDHAHIARNESASPATNVVTYFAPKGAALRIDEPKPGNCAF